MTEGIDLIEDFDSYSENTSIVIELIQEYLKKNRFFNYNEIIPYLNSRLTKKSININSEGIKSILESLIKKNYIRKGSKLTKDDIFTNLNRRNIYECVKQNPGIYFYKIVKILKLKISVVVWHLNILEEFNFIKKEKLNGNFGYFDSIIEIEKRKAFHIISREKSRKIIELISLNPKGMTTSRLSRELGMSRNTIKVYLRKMLDINIVYFQKIGNKNLYFINKPQLNLLIKTSIKKKKKYIDIPQVHINLINKKDLSKEESEIGIEKEDFYCIVHKGPIVGANLYVCPTCKTLYCLKCVKALNQDREHCWVCNNSFKLNEE